MPYPNQISVAHYYEENGDLIADPEIVFYVTPMGWFPIAVGMCRTWREYARPTAGGGLAFNNLWAIKAQEDLAKFADTWASNIARQGYIKIAKERGK